MIWAFLMGCEMMAEEYGAPADPSNQTEVVFEVPQGSRAGALGASLAELGLVESADDFAMYVRLTKEGDCIKAGKHILKPSMTANTIIKTLCGKPLANDKPLKILEGWRIREIDAHLASKNLIKAGEYKKWALQPNAFKARFPLPKDTLEGYLYPETYMINPDRFNVKAFIQRQLDELDKIFFQPNQKTKTAKSCGLNSNRISCTAEKQPNHSSRQFSELMIVASMVEREEPKNKNMPLVAGIIWKRLANNWELGIDATSHYALADWNDRKGLLRQLKDTTDPYNTRLKKGLPPTPIGSPSKAALEATLNPKASKYWYYLHDKTQTIRPAVTAKGHLQNRRKYGVW